MNTKRIRECLCDKENLAFALWLLWMAVYYGYRMFALTPWYDELYTYYYFISNGPIYAAIHWPLPNNHVGYSVLSGLLDWFGNATIGLRGVSYLCALLNLWLLYRIGRKQLSKGLAVSAVVLYSSMNLVNQLAVQGRGYTLAASCYLTAICMLQRLGLEHGNQNKKSVRYYMIFSVSLTFGLYVLPSSVYWVLPVCLTGGLYLLLTQQHKKLVQLIISSVIAAVNAVLLYALIWLAIGSNLLSKAEGGEWYGQGHVSIIISAPFQAMKTGIDYMLATPYIQSVERDGYLTAFGGWLQSLLDYFYSGAGIFMAVLTVLGSFFAVAAGISAYKHKQKEKLFLPIYLAAFTVLTPMILAVQCKLPYFRVFSYMGTVLALLAVMLLEGLLKGLAVRWNAADTDRIRAAAAAVCTLLAFGLLISKAYNGQYGTEEYYAEDALEHADIQAAGTLCVTDCFQQYLLKFCYGVECESTQIENADVVLVHRQMADEAYDGFRWEFYHTYDTIAWDYIGKQMTQTYENEDYIVYERVK